MVAGVAAVIAMVFLECHDFINAASTINRVGSDPAVQRNAFFSNRGVVRADVIVVDHPVLCVCGSNAGTARQALAGTLRKTCGRRNGANRIVATDDQCLQRKKTAKGAYCTLADR